MTTTCADLLLHHLQEVLAGALAPAVQLVARVVLPVYILNVEATAVKKAAVHLIHLSVQMLASAHLSHHLHHLLLLLAVQVKPHQAAIT